MFGRLGVCDVKIRTGIVVVTVVMGASHCIVKQDALVDVRVEVRWSRLRLSLSWGCLADSE